MKSSKTYFSLFKIPLLIFTLLLLTVIFGGIEIRNSFSEYVDEFEPVENALEAKRIDLYSDSVLLYRFLAVETIGELNEIEKEISDSDHKCTMIDTRLNTINEKGLLRDSLYSSYLNGLEEHKKAEKIKDGLLEEHKLNIINNNLDSKNYTTQLQTYNEHFNNGIINIETELINLEIEKINLQNRINLIELITLSLAFIFTLLFIIFVTKSLLQVKKEIVEPFENIDKNTKKFVEGNFESKVDSQSEKENVKELQDRINSMFTYVKETTDNDPEKRKDFKEHFLKSEFHEIIELLKNRGNNSKATTMKDLKISLRITHPTLISRLNYLEKHSYIKINKNGRDKIVSLL